MKTPIGKVVFIVQIIAENTYQDERISVSRAWHIGLPILTLEFIVKKKIRSVSVTTTALSFIKFTNQHTHEIRV